MSSGVFAVVFAILMGAFHVDRAALSLAVPVYMFPYAGIQLVSGSFSDLTSRRAAILLGFGSYGAANLLTAFAPNFALFLTSQALQGATNAFTTPILMATLGDVVPARSVGRTMGLFSSANLAGALAGPLLGGALAGVSWRAAYAAIAAISWALMVWYWVWFRRHGTIIARPPRALSLRADLARITQTVGFSVGILATLSFFANAAIRGPVYLGGEYLRDLWGTGAGPAGVILGLYGLAGLLAGPFSGHVIRRVGMYRAIAGSTAGVAVSLAIMTLAPSAQLFAAGNFLLGVSGINAWAALNTLVVSATPEHRGTASSVFGSAKFLAQAVAPIWFTPLYQHAGPRSIFGLSALLALAVLPPLAAFRVIIARKRLPHNGSPSPADRCYSSPSSARRRSS